LISILVKVGVVEGDDETPVQIQDFLISVEMFVGSIAHLIAFSHNEFKSPSAARMEGFYAIRDALGVNDLLADFKHAVKGTNFRRTVDSVDYRPLLTSPSYEDRLQVYRTNNNSLFFYDEDDQTEQMYDRAREFGTEYNYKVVSPKQSTSSR
jgi:hypothetical protein